MTQARYNRNSRGKGDHSQTAEKITRCRLFGYKICEELSQFGTAFAKIYLENEKIKLK